MKIAHYSASPVRFKASLALGLAALSASAARGAVVYDDFTDIQLGPDADPIGTSSLGLRTIMNFNLVLQTITFDGGTNTTDQAFRFSAANNFLGKKGGSKWTRSEILGVALGGNQVSAANLASGEMMDSSTPVDFALFPNNNLTNVFVGLKLDAGNGDFHYGWARFSTGDSAVPGSFDTPVTLTLHDAAFESTPNVGILAGAGAIPEPSNVLLLGLAGGAMALRRRRQGLAA